MRFALMQLCVAMRLDERIKEVFIDGLPIRVCSDVCMFRSHEMEVHLTELALCQRAFGPVAVPVRGSESRAEKSPYD